MPASSSARRAASAALALAVASGCFGGGGITPIRTAFNRGVYHYSQGNFEAAIAEYQLALEDDPNDHRARFNLAMSLEAQAGELGGTSNDETAARLRRAAEAEYRSLLRRRPDDLRASINLAAIEYDRGEVDVAKSRLARVIERHPDVALPQTALAAHLLRETRPREALTVLEGTLVIEPASLEANMLAGEAKAALGDRDGARRSFRKALARDDGDIATLIALARLEIGDRRYDQALVWLHRVLLVAAPHLEAHRLLAECHEARGELESAARHLWVARDLDPSRSDENTSRRYSQRLMALYRRLLEQEEPAAKK